VTPTGHGVPNANEVDSARREQLDVGNGGRAADLDERSDRVTSRDQSPSIEAIRLYWISVVPE
jgi:hypothetical protein